MSRFFCGREIELLAPAGTMEGFGNIIYSAADAVYIGGKSFNMRMHRRDYNFTNQEIEEAIRLAHSLNKKVYITFNNLMDDKELVEAKEFLIFLEAVKPDALIVQDFGALSLIKKLGINIPIHASVMMNVHNREMIEELYKIGITRIVTSREMSLQSIQNYFENSKMEFEYFIHGDMCVVHGSQCLYSGLLFGMSSNRGLCMKPCRWPFKEGDGGTLNYNLAVKDISLYRHLPDLIAAGVCSFKIEGRMRDSKYLVDIINTYGRAIDRYIEDPSGYYVNEDFMEIEEKKVRNLSTAYAFKTPGSYNIDIEGKLEPRIFSKATKELEITEDRVKSLKNILTSNKSISKPSLCVKVNNIAAFKSAVDSGGDEIYLAGDVFREDRPFSRAQIKEAVLYAKNKSVYITLPRMMKERQFTDLRANIDFYIEAGIKGVLITNLGGLTKIKNEKLNLIGDFTLNCYNSRSVDFYGNRGLSRVTASIEAKSSVLKSILKNSKTPVEVIVQGAPVVMYMDHCIYGAKHNVSSQDWCLEYCKNAPNELIDVNGMVHQVFPDQFCRNNMITSSDICYLPVLKEIIELGAKALRIEGQHYSPIVLGKVVKAYREVIDGGSCSIEELEGITQRGQSFGSLNFD